VDRRLRCGGIDFPDVVAGLGPSPFLDMGGAMDVVGIRGRLRSVSVCHALRFGGEKTGRRQEVVSLTRPVERTNVVRFNLRPKAFLTGVAVLDFSCLVGREHSDGALSDQYRDESG